MERNEIKGIVEALLFMSNEAIKVEQMKDIIENEQVTVKDIKDCLSDLTEEYNGNGRSIQVEEIAGGWQLRTKPEYGDWIKKLIKVQKKDRFSLPALETLAIIAYRQPITRNEIEAIRGVNIDYVVRMLLDKGFIRTVGRKDIPGKPFLYGTSTKFLQHFGLSSLKDLPEAEELKVVKKD